MYVLINIMEIFQGKGVWYGINDPDSEYWGGEISEKR